MEYNKTLHIKVTDTNDDRWEVPYTISDEYKKEAEECHTMMSLENLGFDFQKDRTKRFFFTLSNILFVL